MTKLLKKSLAVVISVALCLSVMVCGFVTSAEGNPTITAKVAETAIAGENVEISIYAEGFAAAAIAGAEFTVELGELAYVALADGAVTGIDAYTNVVDNTVKFVSEDIDEQVTADGALFTITAALPAEAEDGAEFTVSIVDGIFCTAADGEPEVEVDAVDGVVTIATPVVDPSVAINVSPAEGYIGDEIAIEVVAANFDKVAGAQFVVDLAGLEYVSVASDAIEDIEEYINAVDGGVKFVNEKVADGLVDIEAAEGVLFTITAKIVSEDDAEIAIVDSKFCEGGEGEPVIENVILAGATVASLGNKVPTEPDANLAPALYTSRLAISSKLGFYYTFYFTSAIKESLGYEFDSIALKLESDAVDGTTYNLTGEKKIVVLDSSCDDSVFNDSAAAYGMYTINYSETAMYEQMIKVTPTVYLYNAGELVGFYTYPAQSLKDIALETYPSADAAKKSLIVDFLNMGAAAQKYFDEKAGGNTYIGGLDLPNDTDIIDASLATTYSYTDADKAFEATDKQVLYPALQMLTAPTFYYTFYNSNYKVPADVSFSISYESKALEATVSDEFIGSDLPADKLPQAERFGLYTFSFDKIALYDADKPITCTVTTADATWTYTRTLNSFVFEMLDKTTGSMHDLYDAVAAFSAATRNVWPAY